MTWRGLPCASQMARLRAMITQIGLSSIAPAPAMATPRRAPAPDHARSGASAAGHGAGPEPVAVTRSAPAPSAHEESAPALPDTHRRAQADDLPPPLPDMRGGARPHGQHEPPQPLPSAAAPRGRTDLSAATQAWAQMRAGHAPSASAPPAPDMPGPAVRDMWAAEPPPPRPRPPHPAWRDPLPEDALLPRPVSARPERVLQPPLSATAHRLTEPHAGPVPTESVHYRRPRAAAPGDAGEPDHVPRSAAAADGMSAIGELWQAAHGTGSAGHAHDAAMQRLQTPPPLSDTSVRGMAGPLPEQAHTTLDIGATERRMRLDAAR